MTRAEMVVEVVVYLRLLAIESFTEFSSLMTRAEMFVEAVVYLRLLAIESFTEFTSHGNFRFDIN